MRAVFAGDESWNPDPADLRCTGEIQLINKVWDVLFIDYILD